MPCATGIIIDQFSALREASQERETQMKDSSFIADIERATYEDNSWNFDDLNADEHNMWNYVYLLAYVKEKACVHWGCMRKTTHTQ